MFSARSQDACRHGPRTCDEHFDPAPSFLTPPELLLTLLAVAALTGCGSADGEVATSPASARPTTSRLPLQRDRHNRHSRRATDDTGPRDDSATGDGRDGDAEQRRQRRPRGAGRLRPLLALHARARHRHARPRSRGDRRRIEIDDPDAMGQDGRRKECRPSTRGGRGGRFEPPSEEEQEKMQEQALEFSKCMREHGIDMPDPQFSEDGGVTINAEVEGGRGWPASGRRGLPGRHRGVRRTRWRDSSAPPNRWVTDAGQVVDRDRGRRRGVAVTGVRGDAAPTPAPTSLPTTPIRHSRPSKRRSSSDAISSSRTSSTVSSGTDRSRR